MSEFYLPSIREQLSQGDVLLGVPVCDFAPNGELSRREISGVILSHDCDIDKPTNRILLVGELRQLEALEKRKPGIGPLVRSNRLFNAMHIPAHTPDWDESLLDFRFIFRALAEDISRLNGEGRRRASFSGETRLALGTILFRFFTRTEPG